MHFLTHYAETFVYSLKLRGGATTPKVVGPNLMLLMIFNPILTINDI